MIIRGALRGHNNLSFGWSTSGRPIGHPGGGNPQGVFGVFSYYQLVMLFLNMVSLTMAHALINSVLVGDSSVCDHDGARARISVSGRPCDCQRSLKMVFGAVPVNR
jgi:hypothetical protein